MDYLRWNDEIASKFFNPEAAGRRVYLHVTKELIAEIGRDKGISFADFVRSIKGGPPWCSGVPLCLRASEAFANWRRRKVPSKLPFPPYIGFLSLFVLAAGLGDEGEFSIQAYYPRLRKLLGEEQSAGPYPHFAGMRDLWADLETWSQSDKHGELGIFEYPPTGRFVNVGVPISQTILTEQERRDLPLIFGDAGLDAGAPPAESYLGSILQEFGAGRLRPRTLRILRDPVTHKEEYEGLLGAVLDELNEWDGSVKNETEKGPKKVSVHASLRLCLEEIDQVAGRVALRLRCRTAHEFPEDGLVIALHSARYSCQEYGGGWSTILEEEDGGNPVDAADFDVFSSLGMREFTYGWRFTLPASTVRVFVNGALEGLPGYVEVHQLPAGTSFFMVVDQPAWGLVEKWGQSSCQGFKHLDISDGIPYGCRIYRVERATNDDIVRDVYPVLSFPAAERIRWQGGIRLSGNTFFDFALPNVVVESSGPVKVFCNNHLLPKSEQGDFLLPRPVQDGTQLRIEVRRHENTVARKSLFVSAKFQWQGLSPLEWFDSFGIDSQIESAPRAAGAIVEFDLPSSFDGWISTMPSLIEPAHDKLDAGNVLLPPQSPVVEAPHWFDVGEELPKIIHEWRDEISSEQVLTDYVSQLALRVGGRDLSEAALLYKRGHLTGDARSFNRALGIFANLLNSSADPLVTLIARAYLQLAYYRSGRLGKVPSMDIPPLPKEFARLEAEMHGLAWMCGAEPHALGSQDGLGFSDISPLDADRILEAEIEARIVTPSTQLASEPAHAPRTEETYESESEKSSARSLGPSASVSVRPARKFNYAPKCPLCRMRFELYIELTAHLQSGCTNPRAPLRQPSPNRRRPSPRTSGRKKRTRLCDQKGFRHLRGEPHEMTKCRYCGCPVRSINLTRHIGRCPKNPGTGDSGVTRS
ncbi:MAG TPA: hypothetical protein VMI10_24900 [Terriglobales bacterium]|nr:hypothetical protein [Terriglobales bacterium]